MMSQVLPELRDDLQLLPGPRALDGSPTWSIFDPLRNKYFRIGGLEPGEKKSIRGVIYIVPADEKAKIEGLVKDLKDAVASEDFDKMKSLKDEIQQAFYAISQALYQDAGGGMPDMGDMGDMMMDPLVAS